MAVLLLRRGRGKKALQSEEKALQWAKMARRDSSSCGSGHIEFYGRLLPLCLLPSGCDGALSSGLSWTFPVIVMATVTCLGAGGCVT